MSDLQFKELPKIHTTYANVIKSLLPHGDSKASELPTAVYSVEKLVIDQGNLREYRKICGFMDDGRVPATYFAVLSQTLQMNMMAKPDFPFAMLGLVHIHNSVTQHRVIFDTETVSMAVRLDNLKAHDKGQQFDFITTVSIGDEVIWQGVSTYLSRQKKSKQERAANPAKPETANPKPEVIEGGLHTVVDVPEDIGRRYAFVSGDFNLIHLHPLSARAFGFPKAIAHGMWTKAKSLALLSKAYKLPAAYTVEVAFKQPVFLPSKAELISDVPCDLGIEFGLYAVSSDKPHLVGSIAFL
ncbi:acyl dehydratase [Moraxella sp. FZFQ2102]|uniref:MaoC family dehydratase n=1 Tax=Moraxella sp. FZFQ2102 TaxID=2953752 RepID=UPI00209BC24A|nr:MaoC/PaaZ C-terminal domain-containing protein [Moraxella sp. FZFQ2102]USZ15103.1 acyl dehydratase [Moraxella sp. FZFQ2102]